MKQVGQRARIVLAKQATSPRGEDASEDSEEGPHIGASIVYIDQCALTRDCVARQLARFLPEFRVAALSSPVEVKNAARRARRVGCVIYHTHSLLVEEAPVVRGLCLLRWAVSSARIVLLSDVEAADNVIGAMRRGIAGYVPTSLSLKIAAEAIRLVLAGGTFVPASALTISSRPEPVRTKEMFNGANGSAPIRFTLRQNQVVRHLWEGEANKAIAHELGMSEGTVKVHIKNIMKKLHATNRTQVVLITQKMFGKDDPLQTERISNMQRSLLAPQTARAG
jgi:DNA-binding NarL/FixJ family response regulator